jgi:two-component system chemotaxis response regulator CheY
MINLEDDLAQDYLAESREQLARIETDLLAIEAGGPQPHLETVDRAARALHWLVDGADRFELGKIRALAHQMEEVLSKIRSHTLTTGPTRMRVLLGAVDSLRELLENPGASNLADIAALMAALGSLGKEPGPLESGTPPAAGRQHNGKPLRTLLAEDDFASRLLLQTFLARYGECHVAVNGREAVAAFRSALEHGLRYDLICMDIMMPEMDGREAVKQVRALEEEFGILSSSGAKIIMTTAVDDVKEVVRCFHELCDCYLTKPVDLATLLGHMKTYQLI